ncbi:MAG: ethanolamine ammonia-lyase subunit EutC [Spirochaetes bacterium]|nr:ethanolamine ammonia-lyase subunit EutC [Spirochaetota bacterium]
MTEKEIIDQVTAIIIKQLQEQSPDRMPWKSDVSQVKADLVFQHGGSGAESPAMQSSVGVASTKQDDSAALNTLEEQKASVGVKTPKDLSVLQQMKKLTPARVCVGKAGARLRTSTLLALRADHAAARDAVMKDVDEKILQKMNLFSVQTLCTSRNEHLTRPDLGRQFSKETLDLLKSKCKQNPKVQVYVSDGLSSQAVNANCEDILPALLEGLKSFEIEAGTPFFVKFGRCPSEDVISETLGADVVCLLIGERPGLATADSMSAYIAYKATVGMSESRRTVVSNIHKGGTPAVEAGAHIAELIKTILEKKASGVELQR